MSEPARALPGLALRAAEILATDPAGLGGIRLVAAHGGRRDAFLHRLHGLLPPATPWRRLPLHTGDDRLLGGLDLAATLQAGSPVAQRGLLAECDGGVLVLAMAERLPAGTVARLCAALDSGHVQMAREGFVATLPARVALVALDEGLDTEALAPPLADRLALHLALDAVLDDAIAEPEPLAHAIVRVEAARRRLPQVRVDESAVQALCATALALGIGSLRAPLLALRAARCGAALDGRDGVSEADLQCAAGLVLAPRATRLPPDDVSPPEAQPPADAAPEAPAGSPSDADPATDPQTLGELEDRVLAAAQAAIPAGLLGLLKAGAPVRAGAAGRAGAARLGVSRGRPAGTRRGAPRAGARLSLIDTLRAAAPWQPLRRGMAGAPARLVVQRDDLRVTRYKPRLRTTTVFVVDASGSSALHRLAEAKGAVELLLADCYVRRDSVALLTFRGQGADLLLPPTRSLVRARRALAGLPGGGGTPLAAAIEAASALADAVRRRGDQPLVVLLTDGRANIARDGTPGREQAARDALAAARAFRAAGNGALLLDTSPQPQQAAAALAQAMGALYRPLPHADAARLSQAVRAAAPARP